MIFKRQRNGECPQFGWCVKKVSHRNRYNSSRYGFATSETIFPQRDPSGNGFAKNKNQIPAAGGIALGGCPASVEVFKRAPSRAFKRRRADKQLPRAPAYFPDWHYHADSFSGSIFQTPSDTTRNGRRPAVGEHTTRRRRRRRRDFRVRVQK